MEIRLGYGVVWIKDRVKVVEHKDRGFDLS